VCRALIFGTHFWKIGNIGQKMINFKRRWRRCKIIGIWIIYLFLKINIEKLSNLKILKVFEKI
jgi:hypothetical protein